VCIVTVNTQQRQPLLQLQVWLHLACAGHDCCWEALRLSAWVALQGEGWASATGCCLKQGLLLLLLPLPLPLLQLLPCPLFSVCKCLGDCISKVGICEALEGGGATG